MPRRPIPVLHLKISPFPGKSEIVLEFIGLYQGRSIPKYSAVSPATLDIGKKTWDCDKIGRILNDALLNDKSVRDVLIKGVATQQEDQALNHEIIMRLIMDIESQPDQPELLLHLPWELLHDESKFLLRDERLSVARRINIMNVTYEAGNDEGIDPPLRVLLAYAKSKDQSADSLREIELFKETIDTAANIIRSVDELRDVVVLENTTKDSLKSAIEKGSNGQGYHVIHFIGHGEVESQFTNMGALFLGHPNSPMFDTISATELASWIKDAKSPPKLFVSMACHSGNPSMYGFAGIGTALLDAGVEAVVACQTALYTDEAKTFTQAFYQQLMQSFLVDDAVHAGRKALQEYDPMPPGTSRFLSAGSLETSPVGTAPRSHTLIFTTQPRGTDEVNLLDIPAWAVPVYYLRGSGWINLKDPPSSYPWRDGKMMIFIPEGRFYMDQFPVTREEYRKFARAEKRELPNWPEPDLANIKNRLKKYFDLTPAIEQAWEPNLPATHVTIADANAYAAWAGKHIPTPKEWQTAALSGQPDKSSLYPWGYEISGRLCNTYNHKLNEPWPVQFSESDSPMSQIGLFDMVGNVAEFAIDAGGQIVICGGSFLDDPEGCAVLVIRAINPSFFGNQIGFRCAAALNEWMDEKDIL